MTDPAPPTAPPPTLADALAKMAGAVNDNMGAMIHGQRWPEVKAQLAAQADLAAQAAARAATLQRRDRTARVVAFALLLAFLAALAPALVVLAWRAAL